MDYDQILSALIKHNKPTGLAYVGCSDSVVTSLWPVERPKNTKWVSSSLRLHAKIKQQPQKFADIEFYFEFVSCIAAETSFYEASLNEFSGAISPDVLKQYWQNIKTIKSIKRHTKTLVELYEEDQQPHNTWKNINWMIVDQLAALDALRGSKKILAQLDGMIIKVACPAEDELPADLETSSSKKIIQWLEQHNFKPVVQKEGRHKSFAHILFLRDWKFEHTIVSNTKQEALEKLERITDRFSQAKLTCEQKTKQAKVDYQTILSEKEKLINALTQTQKQAQEELEEQVSKLSAQLKEAKIENDGVKVDYGQRLENVQSGLNVQFKKTLKLSEECEETEKNMAIFKAKDKTNLEQIERLEVQAADLTNKLKLVQKESLQGEKLVKLSVQDLESLREKYKALKKGDDEKIDLLRRVQNKLLAAAANNKAPENQIEQQAASTKNLDEHN